MELDPHGKDPFDLIKRANPTGNGYAAIVGAFSCEMMCLLVTI